MNFVRMLFLASLLLIACGDDDGGADSAVPDTGADATADTGADAAVDAPVEGTDVVVLVIAPEDMSPIEGATVEAISAAGTEMAMTAADGRATVSVDLEGGGVVHASIAGRIAATVVSLDTASLATFGMADELRLPLGVLAGEFESVEITGSFANGDPEGEWNTVTPDRGFRSHFGNNPMYSIDVEPNAERTAAVLEFDLRPDETGRRAGRSALITNGKMLTIPATATDAVVDVDYAVDALTVQNATGTYPVPPVGHAFHETVTSFFVVGDLDNPGWFIGESGVVNAELDDSVFNYEARWIEPPGASRPTTRYIMSSGPLTIATDVDGYPSDGAQAVEWMDTVEVQSPGFGEPLRVGETATATGIDPAHTTAIVIQDESADPSVFIWQVNVPPGAPMILPAPPANTRLTGTTYGGRITACDFVDAGTDDFRCQRASTGRAFDIEL